MAPVDEEEKLLRTIAPQNAQSILQARQQAEEDLRTQTERLRITLASIGDAVISTDADGRVTFMNGVAEKLTGWLQTEAIGRRVTDVFHVVDERTGHTVERPALRALEQGTVAGLATHTVLIARNGTARSIDGCAAPMRDESGAVLGAVLVFSDITERRSAEQSRALLAAIVEASDDAIVSKTLEGVIQSWNAAAERLFGYTAAEAVGQSITLIIPPERHEEERTILERLRRGERVDHFETVRVAKDGRRIDISLTVSPVRDQEGHVIGASKVARDITERKQLDAALREADRRKDEFLALLAHELRAPLAPLRNGLQVLRLAGSEPATVSQVRAMMDRQLGNMVRLIDDLLDVSRISQNKIELRRARVPLASVIDSAVETARPFIEKERHELSVSLPTEPLFVDADLTRLAQVFANLLTNSAKYTRPGGHIWLTAERQGQSAVVTVRDDGIGIPPDALPRLFDMFSQVDRSIDRMSDGLGIGLALVKGLLEMHGGRVSADSRGPGNGSTFTVELPALDPKAAPVAPTPTQDMPMAAGNGRRILIADDNRDSAASLASLLRLLGNETRVAHDGIQAVREAEEFRPQIILMDVGMPRVNGYEATRQIRQQPWGRSAIIIALTGWGQEGDRIQSREAGCDGHLVKPVNLPDLEKMLTRLDEPFSGRQRVV
jgi:PAS domain S-box-containing protein